MSKSIQLFDGITDEQVQTILSKLPSRKYKKNHMLIFEDDPIEKIYIIKSGMLKVYRMHEGKELILGFAKRHEVLGEIELFSDGNALSSVEVIEDGEIYYLSQADFTTLLYENKVLLKNIFRIYNQRFKALNRQIQNLTFHSVHTRVCRTLLDFIENSEASTDLIIQHTNQSTIASIIGATRESVSKTFKDLQDEKIIALESKKIRILNLSKLKAYANI